MADKTKYSEKAIDVAIDELGDLVTALLARDTIVSQLLRDLAERLAGVEATVARSRSSGTS